MKNDIVIFENQNIRLIVNLNDETVWLSQQQMSKLFGKDISTINEHINNIFKEMELDKKTCSGNSSKSTGGRRPRLYNLDVIISVGYRVKSKNGVIFRKWATGILKDYMLKGCAVNQRRLAYLERTVKLIDIAGKIDQRLNGDEAQEIIKVINNYSNALNLLDDYDHAIISKPSGMDSSNKIRYVNCINIVKKLKFNSKAAYLP